jgi:hypothetical protein
MHIHIAENGAVVNGYTEILHPEAATAAAAAVVIEKFHLIAS